MTEVIRTRPYQKKRKEKKELPENISMKLKTRGYQSHAKGQRIGSTPSKSPTPLIDNAIDANQHTEGLGTFPCWCIITHFKAHTARGGRVLALGKRGGNLSTSAEGEKLDRLVRGC
jgi:hypothetical protein